MKNDPLFPYAVSTALRFQLSDFDDPETGARVVVRTLGGENTGSEEDGEQTNDPSYDLTGNTTWSKLTFRISVDLLDAELRRILPSTSDVAADTSLVVLVTSSATRLRHGVRLSRDSSGRWTGHTTIQRDDVRGSVSFRPQLVRTTGIPASESLPYATKIGALIATGDTVTLYVDTIPKIGFNSSVEMEWEDFANSNEPWRREHPEDVFHLEPYGSLPRLWLNSRYGQLRDLLESNTKRGPEAVLRDIIADCIAQPVMLQLSFTSLAAIEIDQDSGSASAPSGWKGDLAATLLPGLYPEESSEADRLRRAAEEIREGEGMASLASRLGSVVQDMLASYKAVELAVRAFESGRESQEGTDD
jgi:hypothetical protein